MGHALVAGSLVPALWVLSLCETESALFEENGSGCCSGVLRSSVLLLNALSTLFVESRMADALDISSEAIYWGCSGWTTAGVAAACSLHWQLRDDFFEGGCGWQLSVYRVEATLRHPCNRICFVVWRGWALARNAHRSQMREGAFQTGVLHECWSPS
jgi:hypothetical protein